MKKIIGLLSWLCAFMFLISVYSQEPLQIGTETEDIFLTDDLNIAKAQALKYPDNPEAHFNLAIALSRTSLVEEAIKELKKTKKLIRKPENAGIIDKKITEYKEMLKNDANEFHLNTIRYRLAFAHYLKAYLISKDIQKAVKAGLKPASTKTSKSLDLLGSKTFSLNDSNPEIKKNLEESIHCFNEQLKANPNDIWTKVYYGFILAEQYKDFQKAEKLWIEATKQDPNNPAPHFFLGELKIKEGNLKEGILEISEALLLRSLGN